jgi:hypothetical protein
MLGHHIWGGICPTSMTMHAAQPSPMVWANINPDVLYSCTCTRLQRPPADPCMRLTRCLEHCSLDIWGQRYHNAGTRPAHICADRLRTPSSKTTARWPSIVSYTVCRHRYRSGQSRGPRGHALHMHRVHGAQR